MSLSRKGLTTAKLASQKFGTQKMGTQKTGVSNKPDDNGKQEPVDNRSQLREDSFEGAGKKSFFDYLHKV